MTANYAGAIIEINKAVLPRANHLIEELSQRMPVILLDGYYPNFPQIPYVSLTTEKAAIGPPNISFSTGIIRSFMLGRSMIYKGFYGIRDISAPWLPITCRLTKIVYSGQPT